jgi:hypothetical protein
MVMLNFGEMRRVITAKGAVQCGCSAPFSLVCSVLNRLRRVVIERHPVKEDGNRATSRQLDDSRARYLAIHRRPAGALDGAMPPFLIRNTVPFFEKRWLVSEKRLGNCIVLPSNCRNAALVCG